MRKISHVDARELLNQAANGALQATYQRQLEEHLAGCPDCRAYAAELAGLEASLQVTLEERWPQKGLPGPAKQELLKKLGAQSAGAAGQPWWLWLLLGGAGLLLLLLLLWLLGGAGPAAVVGDTPTATASSTLPVGNASATASATAGGTATPQELVLVAVPDRNLNCRAGNGSNFDIVDTLFEGEEYSPLARGRDNLWVRFAGPAFGEQCWAVAENLDLFINEEPANIENVSEALLPFANYPPSPTPSPTETEQPTATFTPEPPPQCNDGRDNDSDGLVDLRDRECKDALDNDESR